MTNIIASKSTLIIGPQASFAAPLSDWLVIQHVKETGQHLAYLVSHDALANDGYRAIVELVLNGLPEDQVSLHVLPRSDDEVAAFNKKHRDTLAYFNICHEMLGFTKSDLRAAPLSKLDRVFIAATCASGPVDLKGFPFQRVYKATSTQSGMKVTLNQVQPADEEEWEFEAGDSVMQFEWREVEKEIV